jgi:hypothetical protein
MSANSQSHSCFTACHQTAKRRAGDTKLERSLLLREPLRTAVYSVVDGKPHVKGRSAHVSMAALYRLWATIPGYLEEVYEVYKGLLHGIRCACH